MRKSIEILRPILNLASGADGGVAFVHLQTSLDAWLEEDEGSNGQKLVEITQRFSRLCQHFLDNLEK